MYKYVKHVQQAKAIPVMAGWKIGNCSSFLLVSFLAFFFQIYLFSPISSPNLLHLPSHPPTNNKLQEVIKIGEGFLNKPEDLCFDEEGVLYTATRDGWIKRMHRNGSWEDWRLIGGDSLLGLTPARAGGIIVCDTQKGLLKVGEDGVNVLTSHVNGVAIRFADDVIEARDGSVYFSFASTKFGLHDWYLDVLEAKPHGQLLKYDPHSNETSILLDDLAFANGVALSQNEDFLVVCETWRFRCLKYWLKGEEKGRTEIFVDNLPGGPDNINLAHDGSFWIALLELSEEGMGFVHKSKALKHVVATYPKLQGVIQGMQKKARVVKVGSDDDGKKKKKMIMMERFDDFNGRVMTFVTNALEFEDHLYLGSLNTNFIGKLPLTPST